MPVGSEITKVTCGVACGDYTPRLERHRDLVRDGNSLERGLIGPREIG
jgi:hypothetical protein